jgi:hypothetical protein
MARGGTRSRWWTGSRLTSQAQPGQKYYQLTHDYLVHSLRDWLTRKQQETRRFRAAGGEARCEGCGDCGVVGRRADDYRHDDFKQGSCNSQVRLLEFRKELAHQITLLVPVARIVWSLA